MALFTGANDTLAVVGSILALKDMYDPKDWKNITDGFSAMIRQAKSFMKMMDADFTKAFPKCKDDLIDAEGVILTAASLLEQYLDSNDPSALKNFMD